MINANNTKKYIIIYYECQLYLISLYAVPCSVKLEISLCNSLLYFFPTQKELLKVSWRGSEFSVKHPNIADFGTIQ